MNEGLPRTFPLLGLFGALLCCEDLPCSLRPGTTVRSGVVAAWLWEAVSVLVSAHWVSSSRPAPLCHRTRMGALCTEQETRADLSSSPGTSRGHAGCALKAADSEGGWQHEVLLTGSLRKP